jgi:N-acetylglucosamine kinase-like BadF-type ATPase
MSDPNQDIIPLLNKEMSLQLPGQITMEELEQELTNHINYLINTDFEKLIYYLYRIDVNETKMKKLLQQEEGVNAGQLIARLIIDRQLQKIKSRAENRTDAVDNEDAERW